MSLQSGLPLSFLWRGSRCRAWDDEFKLRNSCCEHADLSSQQNLTKASFVSSWLATAKFEFFALANSSAVQFVVNFSPPTLAILWKATTDRRIFTVQKFFISPRKIHDRSVCEVHSEWSHLTDWRFYVWPSHLKSRWGIYRRTRDIRLATN